LGVVLALFIVPLILNYAGLARSVLDHRGLGFIWVLLWIYFYDIPSKQKRLTAEEYHYIHQGQEHQDITQSIKIKMDQTFEFPQTWAYITGKALIESHILVFFILVCRLTSHPHSVWILKNQVSNS
jgi:ACS family hexuronate transporter-like MFS transporter